MPKKIRFDIEEYSNMSFEDRIKKLLGKQIFITEASMRSSSDPSNTIIAVLNNCIDNFVEHPPIYVARVLSYSTRIALAFDFNDYRIGHSGSLNEFEENKIKHNTKFLYTKEKIGYIIYDNGETATIDHSCLKKLKHPRNWNTSIECVAGVIDNILQLEFEF